MAFTDLDSSFTYKRLLTATLMSQLAANTTYNKIPVGTVMVFFQAAAPTGWTQVVTQNDKALRVVSGAGGGTGGSHSIATPPTHSHAHTHSVDGGPVLAGANVTGGGTVALQSHTHGTTTSDSTGTTGFSPAFIDVIICSKN